MKSSQSRLAAASKQFGRSYLRVFPWSSLFLCGFIAGLSNGVLNGFRIATPSKELEDTFGLFIIAAPAVCLTLVVGALPFAIADAVARAFAGMSRRYWILLLVAAAACGFLMGGAVYAVYGEPAF
jgi:hypothetical protein